MSSVSVTSDRLTGRVKWFNNKAGYGFITITEGERSGTDVFVNHRSIVVSTPQYIYLVQGEYVSFNLIPAIESTLKKHEFQTGNVSGVNGGLLMCETRRDSRITRMNGSSAAESSDVHMPKSANIRGPGPREDPNWKEVSDDFTDASPAPLSTPSIKRKGRPPSQKQQEKM